MQAPAAAERAPELSSQRPTHAPPRDRVVTAGPAAVRRRKR
jgi:hypothetical protein